MNAQGDPLTFLELAVASRVRCEQSFHGLEEWSPTDWATAMAGECGEACNEIKKLRRIAATPEAGREHAKRHEYAARLANVGDELADVVCYVDLLAQRLGIDLGAAVRSKFNAVSDRVRSPIKLQLPPTDGAL